MGRSSTNGTATATATTPPNELTDEQQTALTALLSGQTVHRWLRDDACAAAYNVQFATDTVSGVIVGATVTTHETDAGEAASMLARVAKRTGSTARVRRRQAAPSRSTALRAFFARPAQVAGDRPAHRRVAHPHPVGLLPPGTVLL